MKKNKGFLLIEAVAATLVLTLVALSITSFIAVERNVTNQILHRVQAVNYLRAAADTLMAKARQYPEHFPGLFDQGEHHDTEICSLPDSDFKQTLKGNISYKVTPVTVSAVPMLKIELISEWTETVPKGKKCSETIVFGIWNPA